MARGGHIWLVDRRKRARHEPPPAVLDFYETEEVEPIARAAEAGAHREITRLTYDGAQLAARAREDLKDGELYRIAAYTRLRLGELLAYAGLT